jgi:hypothetical protein
MKLHYTWVEPKGQGNTQNVRLDFAITVYLRPSQCFGNASTMGVFYLKVWKFFTSIKVS